MSGPLKRQGIHIPEPECPSIVMTAPPPARAHQPVQTAVWFPHHIHPADGDRRDIVKREFPFY